MERSIGQGGVLCSKDISRSGSMSDARRPASVLEAVFCAKWRLAALERLDQWIQ